MRQRIRSRLTFANIVSLIALFVALGGTATAALIITSNSQVAPNTISGHGGSAANKNIIAGSVNATDLAPAAVTNGKLASKAVTAGKLNIPATFTSAGLPDAYGGCGSLTGTWANLSPDVNQRVGYYRDPTGIVHLRGTAVPCGIGYGVIFTLPPGYRPQRRTYFLAARGTTPFNVDTVMRVTIFEKDQQNDPWAPAGGVWPQTDDYVSLDSISFRCGPSGVNGCP